MYASNGLVCLLERISTPSEGRRHRIGCQAAIHEGKLFTHEKGLLGENRRYTREAFAQFLTDFFTTLSLRECRIESTRLHQSFSIRWMYSRLSALATG